MGLFSGSETYVSSSVYNLAGDVALRPRVIPETIFRYMREGRFSVGEQLQTTIVNGGLSG